MECSIKIKGIFIFYKEIIIIARIKGKGGRKKRVWEFIVLLDVLVTSHLLSHWFQEWALNSIPA